MKIKVNNQTTTIASGNSVSDLIQQMKLNDKRLAIEHNRNILSREQFATTMLQDGDIIEMVNLVGGG